MPLNTSESPSPTDTFGQADYFRLSRRLMLLLIGVGIVARLTRYTVGAAIWGDEAMLGLNVRGRGFAGLLEPLDQVQVAPILFLWAERAALLLLGGAEWAVRLVPFLAGVAGLLVFADLCRRAVGPVAATLAVGTLAVARWPVFMTGTLKPYSGDLFWSAVLMALAVRWRQEPSRAWPLAALAAVVPVALGMSYPTVFTAGAVALYLLPSVWAAGPRAAVLYVAYAGGMLGTFAAVYSNVSAHAHDPRAIVTAEFMRVYWADGFPPADLARAAVWAAQIHTGRMMAYPIGDANGGSTLSLLLFVGGVVGCWRAGRRGLVVLCLTPVGLNLLAAVLGLYPYGACGRLTQHLAPAICLMIGVGWAGLIERLSAASRPRARWLTSAALCLGAFGAGQVMYDLYRPHHGPGAAQAQQVGRELRDRVRPQDVVVVSGDRGLSDASLDWYTSGLAAPRVTDLLRAPDSSADRVWLVVMGSNCVPATEEARLLAALGPGWVTARRTEYFYPADEQEVQLHYVVHCLVGHSSPPLP